MKACRLLGVQYWPKWYLMPLNCAWFFQVQLPGLDIGVSLDLGSLVSAVLGSVLAVGRLGVDALPLPISLGAIVLYGKLAN